ncbi:MAG: hypothetical protein JWM57_3539, partial [Phycisphaerales bacterium]|nr:hypothetical protein [Phycisphaerales bacterium]
MLTKIYAAALILFGIGMIIACAVMSARHASFMKVAKPATATIAGDATIRKTGRGSAKLNDENWDFNFPVRFTADGHDATADVRIHGASHLPQGALPEQLNGWRGIAVPIIYDPQEPAHAEAADYATTASWTWGYGIGALLAV